MKLRIVLIWLWFMIPATLLAVVNLMLFDPPMWRVPMLVIQTVMITIIIQQYRKAKLAGRDRIW